MPIKFRCQHCRQFLGISRSKAGEPVDCPTCGRTVRVPNLDGSVAPLPQPKIDVNELAGALDELAKIGDDGDEGVPVDEIEPEVHKPVVIKEVAPLPNPEPISVEAAVPAVRVDIHAEPERRAASPTAAASAPLTRSVPATATFGSAIAQPAVIAVIAVSALLMFGAGWYVGSINNAEPDESNDSKTTDGDGKPKTPAKPIVQLRPVYHPDAWKTAIRGRISYRTTEGSTKPDTGARVIVLPEKRAGIAKLPVDGFWSGANDADFRLAVAGLRELGGDAALVDADGNFEIKLPPTAGSYQLIAISSHNANEFNTPIPPSMNSILSEYFDRPKTLIRRLTFERSTVKFSGDAAESWDHTFK